MRSRYQHADKMVFRPAFVTLYISDAKSLPPFQTWITVLGRTWGEEEGRIGEDEGGWVVGGKEGGGKEGGGVRKRGWWEGKGDEVRKRGWWEGRKGGGVRKRG